jgi:CRP/FNR family transcriptional regulator, cyclic AMP receptor protein
VFGFSVPELWSIGPDWNPLHLMGFLGAFLGVFSATKKAMIPLRLVAIASAIAFAIYYFWKQDWLNFLIYSIVFMSNILRLREMLELAQTMKSLTSTDFPVETLRPFMKSINFKPEAALFRKQDNATDAYYIVSGRVHLPEIETELGPGSLVGEMGLFSDRQARAYTVVAMNNVVALKISYHDLQELCLQNPAFGISLFKLIVRRQVANQKNVASA